MTEQKERVIDLKEIFKLFRKHLVLIILSTFIVAIIGSVYTFFIATPVYTSSTQLVVKLPDSDNSQAYAGQVTGNIQMANTINQVIVSPAILGQVQTKLNLNETVKELQSNITASNTTNSQVITITVRNRNPYTAKNIANETAKIFSDDAQKLLNVTNVSILADATTNASPVSPRPKLYIAVSILAGLIVGIIMTLVFELFNNKVVNEEDIEQLGFIVLGSTPYASEKDFIVKKSLETKVEQLSNETASRTRRSAR
ncbi:Wzz/FepE/Etk N-terminal domain-containing protein [Lactococcus nasutitermitis]|uniref:Capsular polysaccharide biosynthesis protein CpsC n=1 Tax=Lactococcus nasutitermitis TaxID=1652957 RepID=A0ABV9JBX1_9LACT|nr:Wzz/FepE/Etk N-terminal domain-containing protein [Lactococcus nasutitermitis]